MDDLLFALPGELCVIRRRTRRLRDFDSGEEGGVMSLSPREGDGVLGGVGGRDGESEIVTSRTSETETMDVVAISRER